MRITPAENLRVPGPADSAQGKSDPKVRPKGVIDGQQVNIPVLSIVRSVSYTHLTLPTTPYV